MRIVGKVGAVALVAAVLCGGAARAVCYTLVCNVPSVSTPTFTKCAGGGYDATATGHATWYSVDGSGSTKAWYGQELKIDKIIGGGNPVAWFANTPQFENFPCDNFVDCETSFADAQGGTTVGSPEACGASATFSYVAIYTAYYDKAADGTYSSNTVTSGESSP